MSAARFELGLLLMAVSLVPLGAGAHALRRRLLPAWDGAPAWLAEAVIGIGALSLVAELVGLLGLLEPVPLTLACVVAGGLLWRAGGGAPASAGEAPRASPADLLPLCVAGAAVTVLVAAWTTRVLPAIDQGMLGPDTLWYHLPQAARFVQDGSITHVQFFETGAGTAFYPASSGLFHAAGMVWLDGDLLSVFLNYGWLALALLAAWCLGRPYGFGGATTTGLAVLLATPIMVETQPGGAYNDIVGLALLLAAAALIVNGGTTGAPGALAAVAGALALGTKLSLVVPLAALAVGAVVISPVGRRARLAAGWAAALLVLGGLWYVRNLFAFGNPVPALELDVGPLSLPSPPLTNLTYSLVHYLDVPGVWSNTFLPGLRDGYGPVWWLLLALAAAGMVGAALAGRTRAERMLGVVAIVSAIGFVFTPQGLGTDSDPVFFKFNLRYPTPALALGLVLLPLVPALGARSRQRLLVLLYAGVLAVTQLDPAIWPTDLREGRFAEPPTRRDAVLALVIGLALAAAAGAVLAWRRTGSRRGLAVVVLGVAVAVAIGGWLIQRDYDRGRYRSFEPMPEIARWAGDVEDARIGIVGFFIQYPMLGRDLSNEVDYVAHHGPHGAFTRIRTCREWRDAINEGGYDYVVTAPFNYPGNLTGPRPDETRWTESDPAARLVRRDRGVVSLYRLDGPLDPAGCPA
jgi:hypothetical protein